MPFIRLGSSRLLNTDHIVSVQSCGDDQCVVHCTGQDAASGGFLIEENEESVLEKLSEARLTEALSYVDAAERSLDEPVALPEPEPEPLPEPEPEPVDLDSRVWPTDR